MKKFLSLILAVLLLGSVTASADAGTVLSLSDPVITITMEDTKSSIDISGLSLCLGLSEQQEALALNLLGDGELLLAAAAKLEGESLLAAVQGLSRTLRIPLPELSGDASVAGLDVSALTASLVNALEIKDEGEGVVSFKLPYAAVNELLEALLPALEDLPDDEAHALAEQIAALKESDSGFQIEGTLTANGESDKNLVVYVYPVKEGELSEVSMVTLISALRKNDTSVNADMWIFAIFDETEGMTSLLQLNCVIENSGSIRASMNLTGKYNLEFFYDQSRQTIRLGVGGPGLAIKLEAAASAGEGDFVMLPLGEAAEALDIVSLSEEELAQLRAELGEAVSGALSFLSKALPTA